MPVVVSMSSARPAYVFLLAMAICFGVTLPAGKLAVEELEPITVAAARFVLAAVLLGVWAARRGSLGLPALSDLPIVLAMGATAVAGYNVLFLYGLELAPATDGAIIVPGFAPVFAVLVGWVALGERSSWRALLGLVVALGGLVAVVDPSGDHRLRSRRRRGDLHGRGCAGGSTRTSGSRRPRVSVQ